MKYLIEGNSLNSSDSRNNCNCIVNIAGNCGDQCNIRGCAYNVCPTNTCPSHCFNKACSPRTDPWILK